MLRSSVIRVAAVLLLVLGVSAEPAWQLLHTEAHRHLEQSPDHDRHQAAPGPSHSEVAADDHDHGHAHPQFEPGLRTARDLPAPEVSLPAVPTPAFASVELMAAPAPVPLTPPPSPLHPPSAQPRAPPVR